MFNKVNIGIKNTLFSNIMWSFLAKIWAMLFFFCADIFYARFLGIDKYAEWAFFFSVANMAFYIGWFGLNISTKVHISKSNNQEECFGASFCVRLSFSIVISVIILLIAPLISQKIGYPKLYSDLQNLMFLMAGMVFFNSFTEFFKHLYIGIQEFKKLCFITFIEYFSYCLFSIILLLFCNNPTSIAAGYCIAGVCLLVCNLLIITRKYNIHLICKGLTNRLLQIDIVKYALPLTLTSIGGLILMEMDTFMLGIFSSEGQVAIYSIAKQLVSKATNVNMAVWTGTVAGLAMITKENFREKKLKFKKVSLLNNAISLFVCICFVLFGKTAIYYVYGSQYSAAGRLLIILIPYYFIFCLSSLYANFLDFMGHARIRALWYISIIVINFSFNYLLIPRYGAVGAAIATISSLIPYTFYCLYDVHHIFKTKSFSK